MNYRLSDEKIKEFTVFAYEIDSDEDLVIPLDKAPALLDAQLAELPKEMKLIETNPWEAEEVVKRSGAGTLYFKSGRFCGELEAKYAHGAYGQGKSDQLAADLLVQNKKRAELAKEIFDDIDAVTFTVNGIHVHLDIGELDKIKAKYLQEKGQDK